MKAKLAKLKTQLIRFGEWEKTPAGRRITLVVLAYVIDSLHARGYLPAIPLPKA